MNKYVLIPHDKYLSFKAFVAENKDSTYTQSKQQSVDENKSENSKGHFINIKSEEKLEPLPEKIKNSNNSDNSENNVSVNTQKSRESTQSSSILYPKVSEKSRHPFPPPGLPAKDNYGSNVSYLSKLKKK